MCNGFDDQHDDRLSKLLLFRSTTVYQQGKYMVYELNSRPILGKDDIKYQCLATIFLCELPQQLANKMGKTNT